ncbi:MAG: cupin domain-containing protein [Candidatus Poribacteria bacterium]
MSTDKGYIVRRIPDDVSPVKCPCGQSIRAITGKDNNLASIHVVTISKDSKVHYHKKLTEFYYVLEGEGELLLNDEVIKLIPNMLVMIKPFTRHRAKGNLKILNIVIPPFDESDEFLID